jgi:aldehyde dehydrogenase (NAD+)
MPKLRRNGPFGQKIQLPPKSVCMRYVSRYFEEFHSIYWLYSSEQFHTRLEATYADQETPCTFSWMCSLYCIFSIGGLSDSPSERATGGIGGEDYLDMAKALLSDVCDEASLDSLRGLILLVST